MTTRIKTLANAIQTKLVDLNDGATPTHTHYFDHVWIGVPKKIPMGDRCIAMIEILSIPDYYYTTCDATTQYDVDFMINIVVKGHVETATEHTMDIVEVVQYSFFTDSKISNNCYGTTVEEVEFIDVVSDERALATGARIRIRCRL